MTAFSVKTGRMTGRRRHSNEERFAAKIKITESGCWEWLGWKDKDGYGAFSFRFPDDTLRDVRASHAALNIYRKNALPLEAQACHTCDWSSCVNPDHLFVGTQLDNVHDMLSKKRHTHGELNHNAVLTESLVISSRKRHQLGESIASISRSIGIKESTISAAIHGQNWRHVSNAPCE